MNYNNLLIEYIDKCPVDEPITIEEIKNYFSDIVKNNNDNLKKSNEQYLCLY